MGILDGKVAIVTGAGHGLGRAEALELAAHGAAILVNDLETSVDGNEAERVGAAERVARAIRDGGGRAVPNNADVGDWESAATIVGEAVTEFGRLDLLVNNAGILRRDPIVEMDEEDLDALIHVHLKGTFAMLRHAGRYWRSRHQAGERDRRSVVNTTSSAGLVGGVGAHAAYGANKAAIAALTSSAAREFSEFGVNVNAIAPVGLTRMNAFSRRLDDGSEPKFDRYDPRDPANNAPLVAWLASPEAGYLTGQVFELYGGMIQHWHGWSRGVALNRDRRWRFDEIGEAMATEVFGTQPSGLPDPSVLEWGWRDNELKQNDDQ